jgi:hypothetical protein
VSSFPFPSLYAFAFVFVDVVVMVDVRKLRKLETRQNASRALV